MCCTKDEFGIVAGTRILEWATVCIDAIDTEA